MNSGKSFDLLKVAYNYEEQGKRVIVMTSGVDDRAGVGKVSSRVGEERSAIPIQEDTDIFTMVESAGRDLYCVLVDEAQFLQKNHIEDLARIVDQLGIPVMAYGLKTDFQNNLFEGSENLLIQADKLEEIKTICWYCDRKAIQNLRLTEDGEPAKDGEQIMIGGNDRYLPVCRKHYHEPKTEAWLEKEKEKMFEELEP